MPNLLNIKEITQNKVVVPGEGPIDAELLFIGQAPAKNEVYKGKPFVGKSGDDYNMCLSFAYIMRDEVRTLNLSEVRAPGDKYANFSIDEQYTWEQDLIRRINEEHIGPKILIPLGNDAMEAVSGRKGITKQRGCPSLARPEIKHDCIVIPTFHPASLGYGANYENWIFIALDMAKAKEIAENFNTFELPIFHFTIEPNLAQVLDRLDWLEKEKPFVTIDIENPHLILSAIGIAWSRYDAISIPFYWGNGNNYWTEEEEILIWKKMAKVLPQLEWGNQHVQFDRRVLQEHGIFLKDPKWDSMLLHHCLYSEMAHRLDVITSIWTNLPYYKTDETEEKGSVIRAGKERNHWEYNCYDAVGAWWAIETLIEDARAENMLEVYEKLYIPVLTPLYKMIMKGVPVDVPRLANVQAELREIVTENVQLMSEEAKVKLYVLFPEENTEKEKKRRKEDDQLNLLSWKQVDLLLYDILNWARYKGGSPTGKEVLEKLAYREKSELPKRLIQIRADRKEIGLFHEDNITNGRIKTEYNLLTDTGRLQSKKGRRKTGMNLQNVKVGEQRKFFIAEKGEVMVLVDQRQAEARVVGMYAKDEKMLALFDTDESIHVKVGKDVFGPNFTKEDPRYKIVKGLTHGGNYGLGAMTYAHMVGIRLSEGKAHLGAYHTAYPGIRKNFHADVKSAIFKTRTLYNPFGRREVFLGSLDDYRTLLKGYAFKPQSTITDVNKLALAHIEKHFTVLMDTHDGLIMSVPESEVDLLVECLQEAYNTEVRIFDYKMTIPVDISVGPNWNDQTEIILN